MKIYEKELKQLEKLYSNTEKRLIQIIANKTIKNQSTDFYKAMLKEVQEELLKTQIASVRLSTSVVNKIYLEGLEKALAMLKIDISDGFTAMHKEAIEILTNNMVNNFLEVNTLVGRQIEDTLREIGLNKASIKFASGQTLKEMQKEVREKLLNENILGIVDKRGRVIPYTVYAELLCRSITAEAQNTSVLNVANEYNKDLVIMSHHNSACEVCQKYEGKIYSISGKDDRYPYLKSIPGFNRGYNNLHPRCRHSISVFIEKYGDDYWDKEETKKLEETKKPKNKNYKELLEDNNVKLDKSLDLINEELLKENSLELNRLLEKYPSVKEFAKNKPFTLMAENLKGSTNAECKTNFDKSKMDISLNINAYKNKQTLELDIESNRKSGWFVNGSKDKAYTQTIAHEFGHVVHNVLIDKYNIDNPLTKNEAMSKAMKQKSLSASRKALDKYDSNIIKEFNKEILEYAKKINPKIDVKASVSKYGKSSSFEFFAECFASLESGMPNEYGEAMGMFLERVFN